MDTDRLAPMLVALAVVLAVAAVGAAAFDGGSPSVGGPLASDAADEPLRVETTGTTTDDGRTSVAADGPPRIDCANGTSEWVVACGYDPGPTAVEFEDQPGGDGLRIRAVNLSEGGFVAVHRVSYLDGAFESSLVGVSGYLSPGLHTDVRVGARVDPDSERRFLAVVYRDSDDDERFEFTTSDGAVDRPYTNTYSAGVGNVSDEAGKVIGDAAVVSPGNELPRAETGADRRVAAGTTVELDATTSSDPDGDSLTYDWTQTGGPSVTLTDGATPTPEFEAPAVDAATELTFEVTVDDGTDTASDEVRITVLPGGGDSSVERNLARGNVSPGSWLQVTLTVPFEAARERASILDGFEGPVERVAIDSIEENGTRVADDEVAFGGTSTDSVTVALRNVSAKSTVVVSYSVLVDANASVGTPITFTGSDEPDVSAGDRTAEFGSDAARVARGPVARADEDGDGRIDDGELRATIVAWSDGEFSDAELRTVIVAWSAR